MELINCLHNYFIDRLVVNATVFGQRFSSSSICVHFCLFTGNWSKFWWENIQISIHSTVLQTSLNAYSDVSPGMFVWERQVDFGYNSRKYQDLNSQYSTLDLNT